MKTLILSIIIGAIAGIIDIIPMFIQKLDKYSIISAFLQWVVVGFVIFHIQFGIEGWIKGLIAALLLAVPIVILVMKTDMKSAIPILGMSAVLGSMVGFISGRLIK